MTPRAFDSDDVARDETTLQFVEIIDCPLCGTAFETVFTDDSLTVEDIVEPPTADHTCPSCGHLWNAPMTGWTFYSEAG